MRRICVLFFVNTHHISSIVPQPTLVAADPPYTCQDSSIVIALTGRYLVEHQESGDDALLLKPDVVADPSMHAFQQADVTMPTDSCTDLPINQAQYTRAVNCSTLALTVAARDLSPSGVESLQQLTVVNPEPVACTATSQLELLVVPRPVLNSLLPSPLACVDQVTCSCVKKSYLSFCSPYLIREM
jgi:hypothetical protein